MVHRKERENREEAYSGISARSFLVVVALLVAILVFSTLDVFGILTI